MFKRLAARHKAGSLPPDAHFKLGRLYQAMGDDAAAESEFASVRQLHEKAHEKVASIMSKLSTHSLK
jgi:hypothetical protein